MTKEQTKSELLNTVIQGNCLEVMKDIPDNSIDLIVTSPPYNMRTRVRNGKYTTREKSEHFSKKYKYFSDDLGIDEYYGFHKSAIQEMLRISKTVIWNFAVVTGSKEAIFKLIGNFNKNIKDIVVWDKGHGQPAMHDGCINRATELILVMESNATAGRTLSNYNFKRGELQDIWRIKRGKNITGVHGATFPEELAEHIVTNFSKESETVLDPFAGSGTTAIACLNTKRNYILIEKEPEYIEVINKRINELKELAKGK